MIIKKDFHVHTCFCDGYATVKDMVEAAIASGVQAIGFSAHAPTPIEGADNYAMLPENEPKYIQEVKSAQKKYELAIFLGIEADYFSVFNQKNYDYVIGSVHHVKVGDRYFSIDDTEEILTRGVNELYGGDYMAMVRDYYDLVGSLVRKTNCQIIGHFDIVNKFNANGKFFDEQGAEYLSYAYAAADKLIKMGAIFEINTSALYKKRKENPNPSFAIIDYIAKRGGRFVFSSDSHTTDSLCKGFSECAHALQERGIKATILDFEAVIKAKE